jgi:sporulation protein YlmC with PRC-barrel domain
MKVSKSVCCKEIKKMDVMDTSGEKIGRVLDLTFTFDESLKLKHFILGGSRTEEFLEAIKLRPDVDPVFDTTPIKKIDDHIHLDTTMNSLKAAHSTISDNEIKFSDLQKLDIIDKDDVKVGRAIDVDFELDGRTALIAGGGLIEEKLEAIGLKDDVDIIVPFEVIVSIDDSIRLSISKDELDASLDGILKEKALEIKKQRQAADDLYRAKKQRVRAYWPYFRPT